jgi:hypothetical protein
MPLVTFSVRLDRSHESLLFEATETWSWLSCICTREQDAKGRQIVAQSIPKERSAAAAKRPAARYWREIGSKPVLCGCATRESREMKDEENEPSEPQTEPEVFSRPGALLSQR